MIPRLALNPDGRSQRRGSGQKEEWEVLTERKGCREREKVKEIDQKEVNEGMGVKLQREGSLQGEESRHDRTELQGLGFLLHTPQTRGVL